MGISRHFPLLVRALGFGEHAYLLFAHLAPRQIQSFAAPHADIGQQSPDIPVHGVRLVNRLQLLVGIPARRLRAEIARCSHALNRIVRYHVPFDRAVQHGLKGSQFLRDRARRGAVGESRVLVSLNVALGNAADGNS
jgi:hypothetical protein